MSESSSIRAGRVPEVPDEDFRRLIRKMVPYLLDKFELFDHVTDDTRLPPPFVTGGFHNLTSAVNITCFVSQDHWIPFFRKHYKRMSSLKLYMQYVFYVLDYYENHFNDVFACLLSSMTFVICATVYFTSNGYSEALHCPYGILVTFFESSLRDGFYMQGGFQGLFKHLDDEEIYQLMRTTLINRVECEYPLSELPTWELREKILRYLPKLNEIEGSAVESHEISTSRSTVAIEMKADITFRELKSRETFWTYRDEEVISFFQEYVKPIVPKDPAPAAPTTVPPSTSFQTLSAPETAAVRAPMDASARETRTSKGRADEVLSIGCVGVPPIPLGSNDTPARAIQRPLADNVLLDGIKKYIKKIEARNVMLNILNFDRMMEKSKLERGPTF